MASRTIRSQGTETGHARDYAGIALEYARKAAADKKQLRHCKWVRLAAQRHLDDLKRSRGRWPYKFDAWYANDVCDFIEKLPHVEGSWETPTIRLEPAQVFILAVVYGWRHKKTPERRRFSVVYEEVARKNAKSTKTAGVTLYSLTCENEPGPQVLIGATTFDQAKKVFHPAKRMVEKLPDLQEAFSLVAWAKSITCGENGGYIQPIHAKSKTQDGHNPHVVALDELHAHETRGLYNVLRSAFGARRNPLLWQITTAGFNLHGVCYEQRTFATKVLERTVIAEHFFAIIYTLDSAEDYGDGRDEGDDPYDETKWIKANPLLGVAVQLDELRQYAIEAQNGDEGEFKTKRLNLWLGAASAWLNAGKWAACSDPTLRLSDFRGLDCYIGADLADKDDVTAVVLAAIDADGRLLVKTWFFLPDAVLKRKSQDDKENVLLYQRWKATRQLWTTPGDFVDHNRVERLIRRLHRALGVKRVTFDQFAAAQAMASRLNEDLGDGEEDFAVVMHKNAANCTDPAKDVEARVKAGPHLLRHDGSPVMHWMVSNAVVSRRVDGSILPKKVTPDSPNKIDGVDALINAIAPIQRPVEEKAGIDDFIRRLALRSADSGAAA